MTKHTPGPYIIENPMGEEYGLWIVEAGKQTYEWRCLASVHQETEYFDKSLHISPREQAANARLFAAAPDLLRECEVHLSWLRHVRPQATGKLPGSVLDGFDQAIKGLSAVIAKAKGNWI